MRKSISILTLIVLCMTLLTLYSCGSSNTVAGKSFKFDSISITYEDSDAGRQAKIEMDNILSSYDMDIMEYVKSDKFVELFGDFTEVEFTFFSDGSYVTSMAKTRLYYKQKGKTVYLYSDKEMQNLLDTYKYTASDETLSNSITTDGIIFSFIFIENLLA